MNKVQAKSTERLLSLDFYRGLTMFLLIAEGSRLYKHLIAPELDGTFIHVIGTQLHHVEWVGLHFWDLIQPFFMFIVGVAMPLSFSRRIAKGDSYKQLATHVVKRSFLMLLLGWAIYCIARGKIVFEFQNVLAQLGVTYFLAFLVIRKPVSIQIAFSILLILINESLYRFFPAEGFNHPFVAGENFGAWFNVLISGDIGPGNWAAFNAIPTAAHTIWGVIAGQVLMGANSDKKKLLLLFAAGAIGLIIGFGLSPVTPIIKRIATSSFVFVSGGWAFIALALCYWVIDVLKYQKGVLFFAIVGMNPLFIYLFAEVGGAKLLNKIFLPFSNALFAWTGQLGSEIILSSIVTFALWYICYWLYKNKIFIKI